MDLIIISDCSLNNKQVEKRWSNYLKFYIQESSWGEYDYYKKTSEANITKLIAKKKLFIII